ncbi:MAG: GFA family protein [Hyphomicrobiaceae bacterium]
MSLKAQCACKAVSIELANDPLRCFVCHCDYCQRMTGSVGNAVAVFRETDVVAMSGEVIELDPKMDKWPGLIRYVCPKCYSNVHWVNPKAYPGFRLVSLGCLDDPSAVKLASTVQNQHRPTWCPQLDATEAFDAYPE